MKYFCSLLSMQVHRLRSQPGYLVSLLMLPVMVFLLASAFSFNNSGNTSVVGVWIPDDSPIAANFYSSLSSFDDNGISFKKADTPQQAKDMVAAGQWECAYIADNKFDDKVASSNYRRLFIEVVSPSTSLNLLIRENVSAAFITALSPHIAVQVLEESDLFFTEDDLFAFQQNFASSPFQLNFVLEYTNNENLQLSSPSQMLGPRIVHGTIAIMLLLFGMLSGVSFAQDAKSAAFMRISAYRGRWGLYLSRLVLSAILGFISSLISVLLLSVFFPSYFVATGGLMYTILLLAAYQIFISAFSFFIASFLPGRSALAVFPFFITACLLLSPIFINLAQIFPSAAIFINLLPPTFYLRLLQNSTLGGWGALGTATLVCSMAGYFIFYLRQKASPK
ncbi:MAG: ABC transporter permease [Oscillospiraceae bacterium]